MIAKLVNGNIVPCPKRGCDGRGGMHTNLPRFYEQHPDIAAQDGYYPVRYAKKPEGDYLSSWKLQSGEHVQVWSAYTPEPEPVDPISSRLEKIEDSLRKLYETVYAMNTSKE